MLSNCTGAQQVQTRVVKWGFFQRRLYYLILWGKQGQSASKIGKCNFSFVSFHLINLAGISQTREGGVYPTLTEGAATYHLDNFPENWMKTKKLGPRRGKGVPYTT